MRVFFSSLFHIFDNAMVLYKLIYNELVLNRDNLTFNDELSFWCFSSGLCCVFRNIFAVHFSDDKSGNTNLRLINVTAAILFYRLTQNLILGTFLVALEQLAKTGLTKLTMITNLYFREYIILTLHEVSCNELIKLIHLSCRFSKHIHLSNVLPTVSGVWT